MPKLHGTETKKIDTDWNKLRNEFFNECTDRNNAVPSINRSPHYVFEWFKKKLKDNG